MKLHIVKRGKWTHEAIALGFGMKTNTGTKYHPKGCNCSLCKKEAQNVRKKAV